MVHRTASGRRDRSDLEALRLVQSQAPRAPPKVHDLVLELDAGYADNFISSADESQKLTYVDTFLESF